MKKHKVATLDTLWCGEKAQVVAGGAKVLLVHLEDGIHAYADRCAHKGVALSEGRLEGCTLVCRAHGWEYDARTGEGINPHGVRLERYRVSLEGEDVFVELEEDDGDR